MSSMKAKIDAKAVRVRRTKRAPRGRDEVTRAIVRAAGELFATRGTVAVSVRDVAERAGVNHGLVHRHFGSKAKLVRAVMQALGEELRASSAGLGGGLPATFLATAVESAYWRVLARALLDGVRPRELQDGFPMVEQLSAAMANARREGLVRDDVDAQLLVGMTLALHLGWLVFEPFIDSALGVHPGASERRADVTTAWLRLLRESAGGPTVKRMRTRRS